MNDKPASSGVQELIDRLRSEGVAEGQTEAEKLLEAARQEAARILDDAKEEAEEITENARKEAKQHQESAESAIQQACRDAVLSLKSQVHERFQQRLQQLVGHTLNDRDFLKQLVLQIAGKSVPSVSEQEMEIVLPEQVLTEEELREQPESAEEPTLTKFALDLTADSLRQGITLRTSPDLPSGIQVQLTDDDIEIELTDESLSELLMSHLRPRFRATLSETKQEKDESSDDQ